MDFYFGQPVKLVDENGDTGLRGTIAGPGRPGRDQNGPLIWVDVIDPGLTAYRGRCQLYVSQLQPDLEPEETMLIPNQSVTLTDDRDFLGFVNGRVVNAANEFTGEYDIIVSKPGASGLTGNKHIAAERLVPLNSVRPNSAPTVKHRTPRAGLHTPPTGA